MSVTEAFRFVGVCLIPIAVTLIMYIGFKHVEKFYIKDNQNLPKILSTKKNRYWIRQIISGIVLGGFSILCFYLSVEVTDFLTDNPTMKVGISPFFPVLGGAVFGWPSALLSTFICVLFRVFIPSFLRWAFVCSCLLGGVLCALVSHYVLHDKPAKWYIGFFLGIFVETLDLLFLFLFKLENISLAYKTIAQFDLFVMLGNGIVAGLSCLFVQIFEREKIIVNIKKDNRISVRIQVWLFAISFIALISTSSLTYVISYSDAYETCSNLSKNCAYDVSNDFATMINGVSPILCVERHIVSEGGFVLTACASEHATLTDSEGILDPEHKGKNYPFLKNQLVGVPRAVTRDFGIKMNDYFTFDDGKFISSIEVSTIKDTPQNSQWHIYEKEIFNLKCLVVYSVEVFEPSSSSEFYNIVIIPFTEIYISAGISYRVVLYLDLLVFTTLFVLFNYVINKRIISNIEIIDGTLNKIMDGDLNQEIILKSAYKEFLTLSDNINLTVGALKNYAGEIERQMESELKVARDIQVGSLPTAFPIEKEYNLYALMNTAKEVGGDFYDYIKMNNGRILILNADVSGKGVPAAMFMMRAKTLFKSLASTTTNLGEIVYKVNNELCEDNEKDMFVTAWVGIFNPETGELNYVNAGHTIPLIKRNGKFEQFVNKHNVVLAAIPDSKYEVETIYLEPGQEIFVYTDGVTEAINDKTEMYGINRLIDVANNTNYFNSKQLLVNISDNIAKFANGVEQFDDITMVMLIYTGKQELNPENTLTLIAKPVSTTVAINYVESVLASRELNPKFIARISIVIDELFANIAFYAYPKGKEGNATVTIDTRDDMLRIRLIDSGAPFDPTAKEDPDVTASIDDRKRGGLGIFIVKNTMDDVRYEYSNFQNILYLDKKIKPEDKIVKKEEKKDAIKEGE